METCARKNQAIGLSSNKVKPKVTKIKNYNISTYKKNSKLYLQRNNLDWLEDHVPQWAKTFKLYFPINLCTEILLDDLTTHSPRIILDHLEFLLSDQIISLCNNGNAPREEKP